MTRPTGQHNPNAPAGLPEDEAARLALYRALYFERFRVRLDTPPTTA